MPSLALDQIILGSAALLGLLAAMYAALSPGEAEGEEEPAGPARSRWPGMAVGLAAAGVLFLGTLPGRPPFSPGGRLGAGVLVGALSAAAAATVLGRRRLGIASAFLFAAGLSLLVAAGTMLAYRGDPSDALFGLALGQAIVALFASKPWEGGRRASAESAMEALPMLTALLAAGVALAIARYADFSASERLAHGEKLWWTAPFVIAGALLAGQVPARALGRGSTVSLLVTAVAAAVVLGVFTVNFPRYLPLMPSVGMGFVSGALLVAVAGTTGGRGAALLGAGLVLALLIVAYRFAAGYGIALAALGFAATSLAWDHAAPDEQTTNDQRPPTDDECPMPNVQCPMSDDGSRITHASPLPLAGLALLTFAALFRVYYWYYGLDETSVYLTAHYTLVGLILGALAPLAFAGAGGAEARASGEEGSESPRQMLLLRLVVLGAAFLLPALLVIFWGIRACAGLLLGLAVGQAYLLWVRLLEGDTLEGATARLAQAASALPALALAVTCVQALDLFDDYAGHVTRSHRIAIVLVLVALFPAAALLRTLTRRRGTIA